MATRILSVGDPFDTADPETVRATFAVLALADTMGLLSEDEAVERLDLPTVRKVARAAGRAGIGSASAATLARAGKLDERHLREAVEALQQALEESPVPEAEWRALLELFDLETLARLTSVAPTSLRRYVAGSRRTPDDVAARLHFLARIVGDLRGAYNDVGVRRWFDRKRTLLGGKSPAGILRAGWIPEDAGPSRVLELARSLRSSAAT
jgi:hypothetical protein